MGGGISIEEANQRQHYIWTVAPKIPTDILIAELGSRDEIFVRELAKGESMQLHGECTVMVVKGR